MKKFSFNVVQNVVNKIADSIFADLEHKKIARNSLLDVITLASLRYQDEPSFKEEIDAYARYRGIR